METSLGEQFYTAARSLFSEEDIFQFSRAPVSTKFIGVKTKTKFASEMLQQFTALADFTEDSQCRDFHFATSRDILKEAEHLSVLWDLEAPAHMLIGTFEQILQKVSTRAADCAHTLKHPEDQSKSLRVR